MRTMYDSVDITRIPPHAAMVAGYVDGAWPTYSQLQRAFPHATKVSITVTGRAGAQVADVEAGNLTPAAGAAWASRELHAGRIPTLYCSSSAWQSCKDAVRNMGGDPSRILWWIAAWDGIAAIPAGAIAKQYRNDETNGYDISSVADFWPGVDPTPAPAPGWPHGHPPADLADPVWLSNPDDGGAVGWRDVHNIAVDDRYLLTLYDSTHPNGQRLLPWPGHGWTDPHNVPADATVPGWAYGPHGWAHL